MPRGRIISPDFWSDGTMVGLSPYARLFYIGTWNFAYCDAGHLPDDATELKLKILPADTIDGTALIDELLTAGRLVRAALPDGRTYLHIPTFTAYQKADSRWKSRCPICQASTKLTEPHPNSSEFSETHQNSLVRGGERKGEEKEGRGNDSPPPRKCPKHINDRDSPPCGACRDARLEREEWEQRRNAAPTPRIDRAKFCDEPGHEDYPLPCQKCARESIAS